jgi:3-oxoacyl-[acyl-carrier protein] reductase
MTRGNALITGGAQGLGRAISQRLAADGWSVVVFDQVDFEADDVVATYQVDVTDRSAVAAAVERVEAEVGPLHGLVNNAGIQRHMPLADGDPSLWDQVLAVNLGGTFNCLRSVGDRMVGRGTGAIVNISSVAAERGGVSRAAYGASKAAVNSLTRAAAVEWAPSGVRVNAIGPGYIDSPLLQSAIESGGISMDKLMDRVPMRKLAQPADIAGSVSFLLSDAAAFITGQVLYVDGGFLADYGVGR